MSSAIHERARASGDQRVGLLHEVVAVTSSERTTVGVAFCDAK